MPLSLRRADRMPKPGAVVCPPHSPRRRRFDSPLGSLRNWFGNGRHGSVSITQDTMLPSTQDGDMVVMHYQDLSVGLGCTLTVSDRCRGLLLYVDGDLTVNGCISMSQRGCWCYPGAVLAGVNTPLVASDGNGVPATGLVVRRRKAGGGDYHSLPGLLWGCGRAAVESELRQGPVAGNGAVWNIPRAGAAGGAGLTSGGTGRPGNVLALSAGGGASGSCYVLGGSQKGGAATCFSGGVGSGGDSGALAAPSAYGGPGGAGGDNGATTSAAGGAGNTGGAGFYGGAGQDGTGGLLILIVRGDVRIGTQGSIVAHGSGGGSPGVPGGGSGGGNILLLHGGVYSNQGSVAASGGVGGDGSPWSLGAAAGGAGSVVVDSIDPL